MLTGVRGVGKTTTARHGWRALSTMKDPDMAEGATIVYLNEIWRPLPSDLGVDGISDVIEMDAASHTGIDDIREI